MPKVYRMHLPKLGPMPIAETQIDALRDLVELLENDPIDDPTDVTGAKLEELEMTEEEIATLPEFEGF